MLACHSQLNLVKNPVTRDQYAKTHVGKGASIGANATIICGHDIGEYAFIGAGAVVTKAIKPYALVVGNPARQIGWVSEAGIKLDSKNSYIIKEMNNIWNEYTNKPFILGE